MSDHLRRDHVRHDQLRYDHIAASWGSNAAAWSARGESPYRDAWRTGTFGAYAVSFLAAMPSYCRTLSLLFHGEVA